MNVSKKSISPFLWICAFLLSASSLKAAISADEELFASAEQHFRSGDYSGASIAFERAGYYSESNTDRTRALLGKAACLKMLRQFDEAEQVLNRVDYTDMNDTLSFESRYQAALCGYLAGHFTNAESQLQQLYYYNRDSSITRGALPLYALVLNEQRRWAEAHEKLEVAITGASIPAAEKDSLLKLLAKAYEPKRFPKLKNMNKAQVLDAILPGLGHAYAGYFWEGTASFGLNLAALAFLGYNVYTKYFITSFTVGTTILQMFYVGGMNRVEILVNKHNYESKTRYNESIKSDVLGIQRRLE